MNNPIVHIGYPKTATKWFQHHFYPNLNNIFFLKRPDVFNILIKPDIFEFDSIAANQQIQTLSENKRLVICEELLLGGLDISFGNGEFIQLMANRIKQTFPDAEIVIVIRNQKQIVESAYNQYIKSGGTYSAGRYLGFKMRFKAFFKNYHLFNLKFFEYDKIIDLYKSLFGNDKVHVFLYEEFYENPRGFIDFYCQTMNLYNKEFPFDTFENRRFSSFSLCLMRSLNHFTFKNTPFKNNVLHIESLYFRTLSICEKIDRLSYFKKHPSKLKESILNKIEDYYRQSNLRLSRHIEIEKLRKYGYPI